MENNLKELERFYHLTVDKVDLNILLIDTAVEINSFLKITYSDFRKLTVPDEKEYFLKTLFDTTLAFIEVLKKNNNLDEKDKILKLISKTPIDIYEIFFAPKLDKDFYFNLKLYQWLKSENKIYKERNFSIVIAGDDSKNLIFPKDELNDFFINNKWKIISVLEGLVYNGHKCGDKYKFYNPLDNSKYKIPYEMSGQISGLKYVDVN